LKKGRTTKLRRGGCGRNWMKPRNREKRGTNMCLVNPGPEMGQRQTLVCENSNVYKG